MNSVMKLKCKLIMTPRRMVKSIILTASSVIFFWLSPASAQVDRGALNGTVTDPQGRVLPGVNVLAVQDATGLHRETVTSAQGTYGIPELPVGTYVVTFAHVGFEPSRFEDVVEDVGKTRTLDARLQLAGAREQVSVSAVNQSLDQTSNSLGTEIERKQVSELPLNGRNWATLTALAPGAVDTGGSNHAIWLAAQLLIGLLLERV